MDFWVRIWEAARQWVSPTTDVELVMLVAEQVDERVSLRQRVIANNDPAERRALRDLEKQLVSNLSLLGFTPTDRSRLGLAEVKAATKLEQLRAARNGG
jgi:phage terminase small subunit